MDSESVKRLSKSIGNRLTKKNFSVSELSELGAEIGIVCARHFEAGHEEHDMDEFLFGLVNSVYENIKRGNKMPELKTEDSQENESNK